MLHVKECQGKRPEDMVELSGASVAFVVGGSPFRYHQQRPHWDSSGISWCPLSDIDANLSIEEFRSKRTEAFTHLDRDGLRRILNAGWYTDKWKNNGVSSPKAILRPDDILIDSVTRHLAESRNLSELLTLLHCIGTSPWFLVEGMEWGSVLAKFVTPELWPARVFRTTGLAEECHVNARVWNDFGHVLLPYIQRASAVAIDIEANESIVWQFGWKSISSTGLVDARANGQDQLNDGELLTAFGTSIAGIDTPCIVGHNILNWDVPVLARHHVRLPAHSNTWDTLLIDWLLEPWKPTHALIVAQNAHRADADAAAAFDHFIAQSARLAPCITDDVLDTHEVVKTLLEDPSLLDHVVERSYPATLRSTCAGRVLLPMDRLADTDWQRSCHVEYFDPVNRAKDPILDPGICRTLAERRDDLSIKLIAVIVTNAAANAVEVRLSMLPRWLVDGSFRSELQAIHTASNYPQTAVYDVTVYCAEDIFALQQDERDALFTVSPIELLHPGAVQLAWLRHESQLLMESEVTQRFPNLPKQREGRALYPMTMDGGKSGWLLFEPPGIGSNTAAWMLIPAIPKWLRLESEARIGEKHTPLPELVPRWIDEAVNRLDVDRLFVSPDTVNRPLYLADVVHCLLNLNRVNRDGDLLLMVLRCDTEAEFVQHTLRYLGLLDAFEGTPLRRLEHAINNHAHLLVCAEWEVNKFLSAAENLGKRLDVVISEVPLHQWYSLTHVTDATHEFPSETLGRSRGDELDDDTETDEDVDAIDERLSSGYIVETIILRSQEIQALVTTALHEWVRSLLGTSAGTATRVWILDSRLVDPIAGCKRLLQLREVPFLPIERLLDKNQVDIFNTLCFPRRDVEAIPTDYESYRQFLETNWGFSDFRPGLQKPAIETLIGTDDDLLMRMPTGGGKSIVFHLPALLRAAYSRRLTVVITPLRALMHDQVQGLWSKHFFRNVDYLSGGRDPWMNQDVYSRVLDGTIQLLFVAPERFRVPRFLEVIERRRTMDGGLEFIVFDEVHCISEWGFEFRPDYLHAAEVIAKLFKTEERAGNPHRLLLTSATVTQRNRDDLTREIRLGVVRAFKELPDDMPHPIQPFIELVSYDVADGATADDGPKFDRIVQILRDHDLARSAALVFVRRRADCHVLSDALNSVAEQAGSPVPQLRALPFHAGLPEVLKTEACDLLKERTVNVLVCTKAFGMGMDIPHIHACIHHQPPSFIEDYLQEVGRTGRDELLRLEAGRERVTASLLFNQANFERNFQQLHERGVKPPVLLDFHAWCLSIAREIPSVGKAVCMVPPKVRSEDLKDYDETTVANSLFWLERMGIATIEGRYPPSLELEVRVATLAAIQGAKTLASRLASVLLEQMEDGRRVFATLQQPEATATPGEVLSDSGAGSKFGSFIKGLLRGVVALIDPKSAVQAREQPPSVTPATDASVSNGWESLIVPITELLSSADGMSQDDLYQALLDLQKADAVRVKKTIVFSRAQSGMPERFWDLIDYTVSYIIQSDGTEVRRTIRRELVEYVRDEVLKQAQSSSAPNGGNGISAVAAQRRSRIVAGRAVRTTLKMLQYAGLEIQETLTGHGAAQFAWHVQPAMRSAIVSSIREQKDVISLLQNALERDAHESATQRNTFGIPLTTIMERLGSKVPVSRIKKLLKILETTGTYHFDAAENEWLSVVTLHSLDALEPYDPNEASDTPIQTRYREMVERDDTTRLRALCMLLLAVLPVERRREFIDAYFECRDGSDIRKLLETFVGDVPDEALAENPELGAILADVQQSQFADRMAELNVEQRSVCTAHYDTTLLVNAGPGAGKTHVLMMRCAHLIHMQRVDPREILVLAFNRAVVHEIRDRIRRLFRALGYGRYTDRLDVCTFHAFALRHNPPSDQYDPDAINDAVHDFAQKMMSDNEFARLLASRYKAVLVDEFQDMNEDFYIVVSRLIRYCAGGGMVIGDDDQDILTWNRRKWYQAYQHNLDGTHGQRLQAEEYFKLFRSTFTPDEHALTLNYRSMEPVVNRALDMLEKAKQTIGLIRMKDGVPLVAHRTGGGRTENLVNGQTWEDAVRQSVAADTSVAILCRSNKECRAIKTAIDQLQLVPQANLELLGAEDFALYQLRHTGGLLDLCMTRREHDFVESYLWDELVEEYRALGHADARRSIDHLQTVFSLLREENNRPRFSELMQFLRELRESDVERLLAKANKGSKQARVTISTVHKVKGLEYDAVILPKSSARFPMTGGNGANPRPAIVDAAEEARLWYVAMTRARDVLYMGWGARENAWWNRQSYAGTTVDGNAVLTGSPAEVFVSWSGQTPQFNVGTQSYIEKEVKTDDQVSIRPNGDIIHAQHRIGKLSSTARGQLNLANHATGTVSNIIRYSCGPYFQQHNPQFYAPLHPEVKKVGWFYTVLVET